MIPRSLETSYCCTHIKKINLQKIQLHIQTHITITRSRENLRFTSTQQTWNILGNRGLISVIQTGFRKVLSKRNHISKECTPTHAHNSLDLHILNKQSWFYLKGKWWWLMAACLPLLPRQTPLPSLIGSDLLSPPRCVLCIVISLYGNQLTNTNSITRITLNTKPELRQRLESLRDRLKPMICNILHSMFYGFVIV